MNVNKFSFSNHAALKLAVHALRSYLSLICEHELYILPNKKVSTTKDHGKICMKDRPPLVRHLLGNCLFKLSKMIAILSMVMFQVTWTTFKFNRTNWERFQRMSYDCGQLPFLCAHLSDYRV